MSAVIGSLRAELSASIAQFQSDMGKAADSLKGFVKDAKKAASDVEGLGKKMSLAITAPLTLLGKAAFDQAKEASVALGQVEAALTSTGGASGKTAPQLEASAKALESISVFDKNDILKGVTAQLLSFGNIQGPVFDRAQKAVVNLASRMGGDLQGAAIKVGRALNDPIQGTAALTRLGIQFTTAQKEQIKTMVQSGQGLEAQNMILDVLAKKFDGAAEALRKASPDARFMQTWRDFKETLGSVIDQVLPPILDELGKLLKDFQALPAPLQKVIVVGAGILAVMGPMLLIFGSLGKVILTVVPWVISLAGAFLGLGAPIIAVVAAVAAAVLAITVFGKAVSDLLHGQFKQAWTDAKATVVGIVNQIKGAWKSLTTPQKVPGPEVGPPTIQGGTGGKLDFDQHNEDQIKKAQNAAEELQKTLDGMGIQLQHGLDDLNLPKATADANALNAKLDDYVKRAQEAGVNTGRFAGQVATLRARIKDLQIQGLAREAETFARTVDEDTLAVQKFGKGGLDPLTDKLTGIDAQYQSLKDKIVDEIKQNAALADSNDAARAAMDRLQKQLDGLEDAHKKATAAAYAQNTAEQKLLELQTQGTNLETRNDIRDFANARNGTGPVSSAQADLQATTDELAKKQIDVAETLTKLEGERDAAARQGYDDQVKRLDSEIDLQKQLSALVNSTTADQLEATKRLNDAFKQFSDDLTTQLSDALVNWKLDLQSVDATFKTLAENLFVKPFVQSGVDQLSGFIKGLIPGLGGSKPDGTPGNPLYVTSQPGIGGTASGLAGLLGGGSSGAAGATGAATGAAGSGFFSSISEWFSGFFASGGYIPPGQWGVVGENGPEPAFGGHSGLDVQPTTSRGTTQVFNITTPDADSFRRSERQIARRAKQRLALA